MPKAWGITSGHTAASIVIAIAALTVSPACRRERASQAPTEGSADEAAPVGADAVALRYGSDVEKLQQTGRFEMTQSGFGGYSEIAFEIDNQLAIARAEDALEIVWDVVDVRNIEMKGSLVADPELRDIVIAQSGGVLVVDERGAVQQEVTDARPENKAQLERFEQLEQAAKTDEERKRLQSTALVFFSAGAFASLPELPEQPLVPGKPLTIEEEEEVSLGGLKVPMDSETTYTLVKIDAASGERIAELQIEATSSGAAETPQGFLAVDATREGVLLFNLDRQIPVQLEATESQAFSQGERALETTTILRTSWQPG